MGLHTYSDICQNVYRIGAPVFLINYLAEESERIEELELLDENGEVNDYLNAPLLKDKWRINGECVEVGRKKKLFAKEFVAGDKVIHLVNTSPYESVGEHNYVIFSDDRSAVEEFRADFLAEIQEAMSICAYDWNKIEDLDSVEQTL